MMPRATATPAEFGRRFEEDEPFWMYRLRV
jgi:hypothetical protein